MRKMCFPNGAKGKPNPNIHANAQKPSMQQSQATDSTLFAPNRSNMPLQRIPNHNAKDINQALMPTVAITPKGCALAIKKLFPHSKQQKRGISAVAGASFYSRSLTILAMKETIEILAD